MASKFMSKKFLEGEDNNEKKYGDGYTTALHY